MISREHTPPIADADMPLDFVGVTEKNGISELFKTDLTFNSCKKNTCSFETFQETQLSVDQDARALRVAVRCPGHIVFAYSTTYMLNIFSCTK